MESCPYPCFHEKAVLNMLIWFCVIIPTLIMLFMVNSDFLTPLMWDWRMVAFQSTICHVHAAGLTID